jgi:hypothetical protein
MGFIPYVLEVAKTTLYEGHGFSRAIDIIGA